ncbi:MAG: hypothetical protein U1E62_01515 [Alsobacter sp.]
MTSKRYKVRSSAIRAAKNAGLDLASLVFFQGPDGLWSFEPTGERYADEPVAESALACPGEPQEGMEAPAPAFPPANANRARPAPSPVGPATKLPGKLPPAAETLVRAVLAGPKTHKELCALIGWRACRPYLLKSAAKAGVTVIAERVEGSLEMTYRGAI